MELWNSEWFSRAQKRADLLGLKWCMYDETLVIAQPIVDFMYPMYDNIPQAKASAETALNLLEKIASEPGPFNFVGQGTSGITASVLGCLERPGSSIIQLRKRGEESHTGDHGLWHLSRAIPTVFMDDTIETGDTIIQVSDKLKQYSDAGVSEKSSIDYVIIGSGVDFGFASWISIIKPKIVICNSITP